MVSINKQTTTDPYISFFEAIIEKNNRNGIAHAFSASNRKIFTAVWICVPITIAPFVTLKVLKQF